MKQTDFRFEFSFLIYLWGWLKSSNKTEGEIYKYKTNLVYAKILINLESMTSCLGVDSSIPLPGLAHIQGSANPAKMNCICLTLNSYIKLISDCIIYRALGIKQFEPIIISAHTLAVDS